MIITKKKTNILVTLILTVSAGILYTSLESFFYSDFGCGCSSTCTGYYPIMSSRIIGYGLLIGSTFLFITSAWKFKGLSRLLTIPASMVFILALYGNGFMIFNKGGCGYSLNQTTFFINQTKLGDFAKKDAETINLDSLKEGKLKGKLLGFSFNGNELTAFKIGEKPLKIRTSFLFWRVRNNVLAQDLSYGLNTFRNFEAERIKGQFEFIGGQGMTEKDFLNEFILTQKGLSTNLKNKRIINSSDGTTRFLFTKE